MRDRARARLPRGVRAGCGGPAPRPGELGRRQLAALVRQLLQAVVERAPRAHVGAVEAAFEAGATEILRYDNGDGAAGTLYEAGNYDAVLLGVPFEALQPRTAREAFMGALVDHLGLPVLPAQGCSTVTPGDEGGVGDTIGGDTIGGDTSAPTDTGTPDATTPVDTVLASDTGGSGTIGPDVLRGVRESRLDSRTLDGGCGATGGGGGSIPWFFMMFFVGWLAASLRARRSSPSGR